MSMFSNVKAKLITQQIFIFLCISCSFTFLFIKNFSEPLAGGNDIDIWEYMGFYLKENLTFSPFPTLNLENNQIFYPYGTSSVFQPWAFERDIFYAILSSVFGSGPWLKIYYLLTILITALGTFTLLFRDYGYARAVGAGYLVSYGNFYAIMEYPVHISKAVLHWTTLSYIADFLIVKRVVLGQSLSLRLILVRVALLFLSLGQDIGYIAGFSLTSFTVSTIFIALLFCYRYFKGKFNLNQILQILKNYRNKFYADFRFSFFLLSLSIILGYIYIPLILQILRETKKFDFTETVSAGLWVHPLRLFIPFFPKVNPGLPAFQKLFGDIPENIGAGSPGLFLVILGGVGLWKARKHITIYIPLLIIFILFVFYNPIHLPTINIFPWHAFNRKPVTSMYAVILCLFALEINFNEFRWHTRKLLLILLVCLACIELYTAYSIKLRYNPYSADYNFSFDKNFFSYMNYVKQQPGEAVLDWPFCAVGGNGVGSEKLCPYYHLNSGIFSLRRFHKKKVMGQYFGRLHPSQIEPYLQAGWDKLFFPDKPDIFKATRQTRCFRPEEWSFFTDFYKYNDFAGMNLYVNLLPEDCVTDFYKRFGKPVAETLVPAAGRVQFFPKSSDLRNQVNLALGSSLKFEPLLNLSESNLIDSNSPSTLTTKGLSAIETNNKDGKWRWALGKETLLSFKLSKSQPLQLNFRFINPIASQSVNLEINGVVLESISNTQGGETIERSLKFQGVSGLNQVIFRYKDWNKHQTTFAPKDDRPMAIQFKKLTISAQE
ncbi:hypothetical protein [Mastigocladopsis repens]|uniref:hypothetical protein n=1 Tax=Mastigocladopsis repens TaxID=221287 RepID=UPI0002DE06F4|nr:hypothetical protein [Mastigocladopsis repens]